MQTTSDVARTSGGVAIDMQRIHHLRIQPSPRTNIAVGLLFCSAAIASLPAVTYSTRDLPEVSRHDSGNSSHSPAVRGVPSPALWHSYHESTYALVCSQSPILSGPNIVRSEQTFLLPGPQPDVYAFLNNVANYPGCHEDVWDVESLGAGRFRWTIAVAGGCGFPYDTIVEAEGEETIICRSLPNSPVTFVGRVQCREFRPAMTEVHVQAAYILPGLAFAEMAAAAIGTSPQEDLQWQMQRAFGGLYSKYLNRTTSQSRRFHSFHD